MIAAVPHQTSDGHQRALFAVVVFCCAVLITAPAGAGVVVWKRVAVTIGLPTSGQLCSNDGNVLICDTTTPTISSGLVGIGSVGPITSLDLSQRTDAIALPVGTAGNRPTGANLANGEIRYNSAAPGVEAYVNGAWEMLLGSGTGVLGTGNGGTGTGTTFTQGSVVFAGPSGIYSQDNAQFFWDDTNHRFGIGTSTPSYDLSFGGAAARTIWMERGASTGNNLTLQAGGGLSGGTNENGGNLVLASGITTGTGTSNIAFNLYPAGASGTADNTALTALTLSATGLTGTTANTTLQANAGSGTNQNGGTLTLASGVSTGTGTSNIAFNVYGAGSTGTTPNAATTAMTIASNGHVGIGTTGPVSSLQVATGGLFSVTGTYGSGATLPAGLTGAGTRMVFYPNKAAFRAGYVSGTQWDDANIGAYSVAMGYNTTASGNAATAMGSSATASGADATAMGSSTTASGWYSTAMGDNTTASGGNSTAMGGSTTASGDAATAMGAQTVAQAYEDTAIGTFNVGGGTPGSWVATDPIFEIGVGALFAPANAVTVLKNGDVGIGSATPVSSLDLSQKTDAVSLPVGTTGTRPTGVNGMIRYNSATPGVEAYVNGAWEALLGGSSGVLGEGNGGTGSSTVFTQGSVVFAGASSYAQDNAQFFWDDTNHRFGIGTATPTQALSISGNIDVMGANGYLTEIANDGTTGTTANKLAKLTSAGAAVITATTDTDGIVGIVIGGAGTAGNAQIAVGGQASCVFDGATTAGDFVEISSTVAGDCKDAGATRPTSSQTIGRVLSTNAGAGTYAVALGLNGAGGGAAAGADTQVQFNNAGSFGADSMMIWDKTNKLLMVGTSAAVPVAASGTIAGVTMNVIPQAVSLSTTGASGATVNTGATGQMAYYSASNTVSGTSNLYVSGSDIAIGTSVASQALTVNGDVDVMSGNGYLMEVPNAGAGTVANKLAKMSSSGAAEAATSDTDGVLGIVVGGAGTSGNAQIAFGGQALCAFDAATTEGDYVTISSMTAGDCKDAGAARPAASQMIGRVLSTNGSAGTYPVAVGINAATDQGMLGSSASATTPERNGEAGTGLYTAGSGAVDVASTGTQIAEFNAGGLNIVTGKVGVGSATPVASLDLSQKTDALALPAGATAQEPGAPVAGMLRYNSTTKYLEYYNGTTWVTVNGNSAPTAGCGQSGTLSSSQMTTLNVSAGCTVVFKVWGAGGGEQGSPSGSGGGGGYATITLGPLSSTTTYYLVVGGGGSGTGVGYGGAGLSGYTGGQGGGNTGYAVDGAGGGAASGIWTGNYGGTPVVVAAGGGGGGGEDDGNPGNPGSAGGSGGTQNSGTAGGTGGTATGNWSAGGGGGGGGYTTGGAGGAVITWQLGAGYGGYGGTNYAATGGAISAGSGTTPGNAADANRPTNAGNGASASSTNGNDGAIYYQTY